MACIPEVRGIGFARADAPMPADSRPRALRADPDATLNQTSVHALRRESPGRASASKRRAMRSCSSPRSLGASANSRTRNGNSAGSGLCLPVAARPAADAIDLQCPRYPLWVIRMDARGTDRVNGRQLRMHSRPSLLGLWPAAATALAVASAAGISDKPSINARKYRPVPPTNKGTLPAADSSFMCGNASLAKSAAENTSCGSRISIIRCGARSQGSGVWLG